MTAVLSRRLMLAILTAAGAASFARRAEAAGKRGILLLAHGDHSDMAHGMDHGAAPAGAAHAGHAGHEGHDLPQKEPGPWNRNILEIAGVLDKNVPTEVAFGMAETPAMQAAIKRLEARGVDEIVAVPLFVSSHSPIIRNFRYILGLQKELGSGTSRRKLARVETKAKIRFTGALDADPLVSDILLDRAKSLAPDPAKAAVVIIAHGPNGEDDNKMWLVDMAKHAAYLKAKGFRGVEVLTQRNDAPPEIKQPARAAFRKRVQEASAGGVVVVVPLLMSEGGIEKELEEDLKGLKFAFAKPLSPHANLGRWVEAQYKAAK
jgi:sirohydrochlorin ferrochelatase